jgi:hypothetical protein
LVVVRGESGFDEKPCDGQTGGNREHDEFGSHAALLWLVCCARQSVNGRRMNR